MDYKYAYLTGGLLLGVVWAVIFLFRKDLRREILLGSLMGLPFGLIEYFFVPYYWNPLSLFDFIRKFGFGIESFIFAFFTAGIASVFYEFLENRRTAKINRKSKNNALLLGLFLAIFILLNLFFPSRPVYDLTVAFAVVTIVIAFLRRDLIPQIVASAFVFAALYWLMYVLTEIIYPGFVLMFYNLQNLSGIFILGVPLEEIIIAFTGGACWSVLYEYSNGYKLKRF